jgi:hypothetical protein
VQQQHAGPAACFEAGLQHVDAQAVDILHVAGADGGGERDLGEAGHRIFLVMAESIAAIHVFL